MSFIEWKSEYATGLAEIDNQHVALIELINFLHEVGSAGVSGVQMQEAVNDLLLYAEGHFGLEETFMAKYAQPELALHKAAHDDLRMKAYDYADRCPAEPQEVCLEMAETLKGWLTAHVLSMDARLARYVKAA